MPTLRSTLLLAALAALAAAPPAAAQDGGPDLFRQSYAAEARGDYNLAYDLLQRLPPAAADTYVVHLRSGWLHYLAGRYARAAEAYQQAIAREPAAVEARLGAMLPLMALRRWQDAEKVGEEALVLAPGDFTALSRLAWTHFNQLRYPEAEQHYRRALAAYPASAEVRTGLGWSLLKLGRFKEAREAFEAVLRFAPDQAAARDGLSQVP
jgi:tetratricopeptide (TPR) repeat protein